MSGHSPGQWYGEPFVMATPDEFAALRAMLERVGYTESDIAATAGVANLNELQKRSVRTQGFLAPDTPQSLLVYLFLDGDDLPWETITSVLAPADLVALQAVGVLQPLRTDATRCFATLALYPIEGMYIASDRHTRIELVASAMPADIVYSAATERTVRFLGLMPRVQCGDYVELCSGSGVAALTAARSFADRTWGVDITERSTRFARFNAALNGVANFEALVGDLYAPASGLTFDVITAHPPYVPSFETEMVFRDGGDDGEQVTRRMLAGLADHLRPGGLFFCDCFMTDREGAPLETRIREMLGPAEGEFHVILGQDRLADIEEIVAGSLSAGRITSEGADAQRTLFRQLGVTRFVDAAFILQRRASPGPVVTRRRNISPATNGGHLLWYLHWSVALAELGSDRGHFLDTYPRCSPHTEIVSRSGLRAGRWTVMATSLQTRVPFAVEADSPPWFGTLLSWCDGRSSARDLFGRLKDAGVLPEETPEASFAMLVSELADGGFLELLPEKDTVVA